MSKSRGTFLTAKEFLATGLDPELLRFYYASNLSHTMSDINLSWKDFEEKINTELLGNVANFAYRVLSFTNKNFDSKIEKIRDCNSAKKLKSEVEERIKIVEEKYHSYEFREAVKVILEISAIGNRYFQGKEPWKLIKEDREKTQEICTLCINLIKDLSIMLKPIVPHYSAKLEKQLNVDEQKWSDIGFNLSNHKINEAEIIFRKLDDKQNIFKEHEEKEESEEKESEVSAFSKLNLKVAKIEKVEDHPDGDRLFVIKIDLGTEQRQVVASIKPFYKKEELVGRNLIVVTNLKPAKLRGVESNGMLLAAEEKGLCEVLHPDNTEPGSKVFIDGVESGEEEITIDEFAKAKFKIKDNKVIVEEKQLKTEKEDIVVKKASDKAWIH